MQHQAAHDAAACQHTGEQPQIRGLGPQLIEGNQRGQSRVIEPDQTQHRGEAEHPLQGAAAVAPGIEQAGVLAAAAAHFPFPIRVEQEHHTGDWQQIAGSINAQGPGRASGRQQQPADRGTHQLAHVEHHRKAGEVARQLVGAFHQN